MGATAVGGDAGSLSSAAMSAADARGGVVGSGASSKVGGSDDGFMVQIFFVVSTTPPKIRCVIRWLCVGGMMT